MCKMTGLLNKTKIRMWKKASQTCGDRDDGKTKQNKKQPNLQKNLNI